MKKQRSLSRRRVARSVGAVPLDHSPGSTPAQPSPRSPSSSRMRLSKIFISSGVPMSRQSTVHRMTSATMTLGEKVRDATDDSLGQMAVVVAG